MSRDQDQDLSPLEDREQLLAYFRSGIKSPDQRGLGTEHEKFGFRRDNNRLMNFDEIETLLSGLAERFGWEADRDQGRIVALTRNDEAVTLEPGGQLELSGGIKRTVFETEAELDVHFQEIAEVAPEFVFTCFGINPFTELDEIGWVPKSRYKVMREYLATRGGLAHWMMKMTCTIQTNFDYTSEKDATSLIRGAYLTSPFIAALFANSPIDHGKPNGFQSKRNHIWTDVDPDRTGVPDFMLSRDWTFDDYVDYVLDVPMFFIRRESGYINMAGKSFRKFWDEGYQGHRATLGDFELHLSTVFPEVRMKKYVEVRCADGGPKSHMLALPAIWKGLIYDTTARKETCDLLCHYSADQIESYFARAAKDGIHAQADDRPFMEILEELLRVARKALDAIAERDGHESEAKFLEPLDRIVATQKSAADLLLEDFAADPEPSTFLQRHALF